MNLLLLLSALLSALTGVSAAARANEPQAVAERMVASPAATRVATATATVRPANVVWSFAGEAWRRIVLSPQPAALAPLYLLRRRE